MTLQTSLYKQALGYHLIIVDEKNSSDRIQWIPWPKSR